MKNLCLSVALSIAYSVSAQTGNDSAAIKFMQSLAERTRSVNGKEFHKFDARSVEGVRYTTDSFKGKLTVINFWFEACAPCLAEVKALNELYDAYKANKHFQFLSFTFDPVRKVRSFVTKNNIGYPVIRLEETVVRKLNYNSGFPVIALVDAAGRIVYFRPGGSNDPQKAKEDIVRDVHPTIDRLLKLYGTYR